MALCLINGCTEDGDSLSDLRDYVSQIQSRRPLPIEPLPQLAVVDAFSYQSKQRRDPFVMDKETAAPPDAFGIAPDPNRPKELLERFALDSLVMQGILQRDDGIWALVLSKEDKTLHRVGVGNYLGQNHGRIIRISEQGLELLEIIPEASGRWLEREAAIALTQDAKPVK